MNGNIKLMYLKEENEMIYIFFFFKKKYKSAFKENFNGKILMQIFQKLYNSFFFSIFRI